jgi:2-iminobutanoate/2-iminopropanoate deaminase
MKVINTEKAPEALGPYSHATEINGLVFTSGHDVEIAPFKKI